MDSTPGYRLDPEKSSGESDAAMLGIPASLGPIVRMSPFSFPVRHGSTHFVRNRNWQVAKLPSWQSNRNCDF